jgi:hypothetical protein
MFSELRCEKLLLQTMQLYGFSPLCERRWTVRLCDWKKPLLQMWQMWGFCLLCMHCWCPLSAACEER